MHAELLLVNILLTIPEDCCILQVFSCQQACIPSLSTPAAHSFHQVIGVPAHASGSDATFLVSCRAEKLLPAFKAFLQSPGPDEDARRSAAYVQQLEQLQNNLVANKQPYIGGQEPSAADLALGPKLYHSTVALKHFKVNSQISLDMHVKLLLSQQTDFC